MLDCSLYHKNYQLKSIAISLVLRLYVDIIIDYIEHQEYPSCRPSLSFELYELGCM